LRRGTGEFYEKSEKPAAAIHCIDLEFPDWSGMDDSSARVTPEAAFRLCQNYPLLLSKVRPDLRNDTREKYTLEFVL